MARKFAKCFYDSKAWKDCRESYINQMPLDRRGLCEECFEKGIHNIGEELHHITWLNEKNINDKEVTLNHKNLKLLCYECHKATHRAKKKIRYKFNDDGEIIEYEENSP